jgi:hypothetical protein
MYQSVYLKTYIDRKSYIIHLYFNSWGRRMKRKEKELHAVQGSPNQIIAEYVRVSVSMKGPAVPPVHAKKELVIACFSGRKAPSISNVQI